MNEPKFLDSPPDHSYEPTCEFKWMEVPYSTNQDYVKMFCPPEKFIHRRVVLCQRFQGTFRDCWVRIPIAPL